MLALQAFLALFEATRAGRAGAGAGAGAGDSEVFLAAAVQAAQYAETWTYVWPIQVGLLFFFLFYRDSNLNTSV